MIKKLNLTAITTIILIISSVVLSSVFGSYESSRLLSTDTHSSTRDEINAEEMRGLWVSYISLDMQETDRSFKSFKEKFDDIIKSAKDMQCNTLIVQIRPFCDALYKSEYFPSSHVLSGTQGLWPDFDALEYMCKTSHQNGLKIHGWINPYRVSSAETPKTLSETNPYIIDNSIGFELESGIYLNPANKSAIKLVSDGVKEIVENYDIDGIHFDDYFYPPDCGDFDKKDYNDYLDSVKNITKAMTHEQWRQNNVNLLLATVYKTIKDIKPEIEFGVSPQGNIENNQRISADVKLWCESVGFVDYICPQMYYSIDHPIVKFEDSLQEWNDFEHHSKLKVYIGIGVYKAGTDADNGTWLTGQNILSSQLKLLRKHDYDGYILYDYGSLKSEKATEELAAFRSVI